VTELRSGQLDGLGDGDGVGGSGAVVVVVGEDVVDGPGDVVLDGLVDSVGLVVVVVVVVLRLVVVGSCTLLRGTHV